MIFTLWIAVHFWQQTKRRVLPTGFSAAAASSSQSSHNIHQTDTVNDDHAQPQTVRVYEHIRYARFHWSVSSTAGENRWLIIWSSLHKHLIYLHFDRFQDLYTINIHGDVHRHPCGVDESTMLESRLCISITVWRNRIDRFGLCVGNCKRCERILANRLWMSPTTRRTTVSSICNLYYFIIRTSIAIRLAASLMQPPTEGREREKDIACTQYMCVESTCYITWTRIGSSSYST